MSKKIIKKMVILAFVFLMVTFVNVLDIKAINKTATSVDVTTSDEVINGDSSYKKVTNTGWFRVATYDSKDRLKAYKILDTFYNADLNAIRYQFTTDFQTFLNSNNTYKNLTVDEYLNLEQDTESYSYDYGADYALSDFFISGPVGSRGEYQTAVGANNGYGSGTSIVEGSYGFTKLMSAYATYVKSNNVDGTSFGESLSTTYGRFEIESLAVGSYMVLPEEASHVYGVMVDSVQLVYSYDNKWAVKSGQIAAKMSASNMTLEYIYGTKNDNILSVDADKDIQVKIQIIVPKYPGDATNSNGITNIKVPLREEGAVNMKLTTKTGTYDSAIQSEMQDSSGTTFGTSSIKRLEDGSLIADINLNTNQLVGSIHSNEQAEEKIELTYTTKLLSNDKNLILGNRGNTDVATVSFPDPYDTTKSIDYTAQGKLMTYGIQVTGTPGAEFDVIQDGKTKEVIYIGEDGKGEVRGYAKGDYVLEQSKAPAGYIKLEGTNTIQVGTGIEVEGKEGYYGITLINRIPSLLPFTGGNGIIQMTFLGVIIITISVVAFIKFKKKKFID